jgi:SAM-dependent methyltransferase
MARRTAAKEAAFLLPYLRPGMRVLDVGCGPGSITLGLAEVVAPGEAIGVDFQPLQVAQAQALSDTRGLTNTRFEVADAYQLPFPDCYFDVVFAHTLLWHLREPVRALTEMRRVLRRGGIVGVRDIDWGGRIHAPLTPVLEQWYEMTVRVRRRNGGNPFMARYQRQLLLDAGFARSEASASVWSAGKPEETRQCSSFLKAQLQGFSKAVLTEGWMDEAALRTVVAEIDAWAERPDALYVEMMCEAVGRK